MNATFYSLIPGRLLGETEVRPEAIRIIPKKRTVRMYLSEFRRISAVFSHDGGMDIKIGERRYFLLVVPDFYTL